MNKKIRKKNNKQKEELKKRTCNFVLLCIITLLFGYYIIVSDDFKPKINELTASYISLNNRNTTDMLKITNLSKMTNKIGISNYNKSTISFNIMGEKGSEYQIILLPISNQIDYKYIHYSLSVNKKTIENTLNKVGSKNEQEKIIYQDIYNKSTKIELRMWIDKDYTEKINHNSFEIKVKAIK